MTLISTNCKIFGRKDWWKKKFNVKKNTVRQIWKPTKNCEDLNRDFILQKVNKNDFSNKMSILKENIEKELVGFYSILDGIFQAQLWLWLWKTKPILSSSFLSSSLLILNLTPRIKRSNKFQVVQRNCTHRIWHLIWIFLILECNEYHDTLKKSLNVVAGADEGEDICPISLSDYVVEGQEADPKEFPHMVSDFTELLFIIILRKIWVWIYS